jgi:hypothetical protein
MLRFLATRGVVLGLLLAPSVYAQDDKPAPDAQAKKAAAARFREAEKAFKKHDYATAAQAFEEAYETAPHPAALFNAATAHQKAGNLTRAANLCARYLRDAPENDARREKANALISELTPKLGRVEIAASGAKDVQLDGKPPELELTYVDPGDHFVTGKFGDKGVTRELSVVAGSLARVVLEPPRAETSSLEEEGANEDPFASDATKDVPAEKTKPLSPTWFYVGVGATVVLGAATVWSGLDTNKARDDFDSEPTQAGLDDGRKKQTRTNVLLAGTAVAGVATATIGIFFTNWGNKKKAAPPADAQLGIGPGFVTVRGRF